jgi:hypothetical protein
MKDGKSSVERLEDRRSAAINDLRPGILKQFEEMRGHIAARTVIGWGKHCGQCCWPFCFASRHLPRARRDRRCAHFNRNMFRISLPNSVNGYLLHVTFQPWERLWASSALKFHPVFIADRMETGSQHTLPTRVKSYLEFGRSKLTRPKRLYGAPSSLASADCMLIECYNPSARTVTLTITIRSSRDRLPFEARLPVSPGYNRLRIPMAVIGTRLDVSSATHMDLALMPDPLDVCSLVFGLMDFIVASAGDERADS